MAACPNIKSKEWEYISQNTLHPDIAWKVWNRIGEDNLDVLIKEETDKYFYNTDRNKFYEIRGFTPEEGNILSKYSIIDIVNILSSPTDEFLQQFLEGDRKSVV